MKIKSTQVFPCTGSLSYHKDEKIYPVLSGEVFHKTLKKGSSMNQSGFDTVDGSEIRRSPPGMLDNKPCKCWDSHYQDYQLVRNARFLNHQQ